MIEAQRGDADSIAQELAHLPFEEIADWQKKYYAFHNALHRGEIRDVADIVYNRLVEFAASDDSYHYFKSWVIGKGREAYETALKDPDGLGRFIMPSDLARYCDNESLSYAAEKAWKRKGRDPEDLKRGSNESEPLQGEPCEPSEWPKRYPRLVKQFGTCRWE